MYLDLHVKCLSFLADFNQIWMCSTDFRKILMSNFRKMRPVRAELLHVHGRTDKRDEVNSRFSRFCEEA
jgi:hypothetical protein